MEFLVLQKLNLYVRPRHLQVHVPNRVLVLVQLPPLFSSPASSTSTSPTVNTTLLTTPPVNVLTPQSTPHVQPLPPCTGIVNPLVAAGLIPEELSDILATPPADARCYKNMQEKKRS